jgi:glycosyltransferase involved in cell wall biosynthesis
MIWIYFILYGALTLLICFGFWLHYQWKKNYATTTDPFSPTEITVIIPFRNEAENLPKLLTSLQALIQKPLEIIFVNDHSTDESIDILKNYEGSLAFKLIELAEGELGKKTAIRKGITHAKGSFILTWDADVSIPNSYFKALGTVNKTDLLLLPVRMKARRLVETLYELDYYYFNGISTSLSFFSKPLVASGANLLVRKADFEEVDSFENHQEIASGDDMFLLEDFKQAGKRVDINTHFNLQVDTETPHTFEDFINQRLRWISKSQYIGNYQSFTLGILGFLYHVGFYLFFFTDASWNQLQLLTMVKIGLDLIVFYPYLLILRRSLLIFMVPAFSLLYPIYSLLIICMTLFYTPTWKGR